MKTKIAICMLVLPALLASGCGTSSKTAEELKIEGQNLGSALEIAQSAGVSLVPDPACEFRVLADGKETIETWKAPQEVPEEYQTAIRIDDVRNSSEGEVRFCGSINSDLLPEIDENTQDLLLAQRLCQQAEGTLDSNVQSLSPAELELTLQLPNLDAMSVNTQTPKFLPLQRFYLLAFGLVDYVNGLNWLEWVSDSQDNVPEQTFNSISSLVRINGNDSVRLTWVDAIREFENSQKQAKALCLKIENLVPLPDASVELSKIDAPGLLQGVARLGEMIPEFMEVSPDGRFLLVASSREVAVVALPELAVVGIRLVANESVDQEISAIAIDATSEFGVISLAGEKSSVLLRIDLATVLTEKFGSSYGRVETLLLPSTTPGVIGTCGLGDYGNDCAIAILDPQGKVTLVKNEIRDPNSENVFGGAARKTGSGNLLIAAPNGVLYEIDIKSQKVKRVLKESVWPNGDALFTSPSDGRIFVFIELLPPSPIGAPVELREITETGLSSGLFGDIPDSKYPINSVMTSIPDQIAFFGTKKKGITRRDATEPRVMQLRVWDLPQLEEMQYPISSENNDFPPIAAHPTEPLIFVAREGGEVGVYSLPR